MKSPHCVVHAQNRAVQKKKLQSALRATQRWKLNEKLEKGTLWVRTSHT
jgi:hypothetical protein